MLEHTMNGARPDDSAHVTRSQRIQEAATVDGKRYLIVTADDYGIGPEVSRGILDLAVQKRITATVLLVNSPHAESAVHAWRQAGSPVELGWHPCLTLDKPILPAERVPSLVDATGRFLPLGRFVARLYRGGIRAAEIEAELRAQYARYHDLVGQPPSVVNTHHHVQIFPPVGPILVELLTRRRRLPYMRRVCEPWRMVARVPGARGKRAFLSLLGRRDARRQRRAGLPGNDWLAGVTDPPHVHDPDFLYRWLTRMTGDVVELTCHPGRLDTSLVGRDGSLEDGQLHRRARELELLQHPRFLEACTRARWTLVTPSELARLHARQSARAA